MHTSGAARHLQIFMSFLVCPRACSSARGTRAAVAAWGTLLVSAIAFWERRAIRTCSAGGAPTTTYMFACCAVSVPMSSIQNRVTLVAAAPVNPVAGSRYICHFRCLSHIFHAWVTALSKLAGVMCMMYLRRCHQVAFDGATSKFLFNIRASREWCIPLRVARLPRSGALRRQSRRGDDTLRIPPSDSIPFVCFRRVGAVLDLATVLMRPARRRCRLINQRVGGARTRRCRQPGAHDTSEQPLQFRFDIWTSHHHLMRPLPPPTFYLERLGSCHCFYPPRRACAAAAFRFKILCLGHCFCPIGCVPADVFAPL
ncbi:hypothetical protein B0H15DRAFT_57632 [Mycena belliarum]|uniref:Secreted protein n=1 Tax=Mycena belliarum TaxID=1033014 RepID=A0AAD6UD12_9AGAR|nr:hypothetical protein B0H15DRAFT_57632 [Mycena belliae]